MASTFDWNKRNIGVGKWKWLQELKREREQDIKIETMEEQWKSNDKDRKD